MQERCNRDYIKAIWTLRRLFKDDTTSILWLNSPNIILKGSTPTNYIYRGRAKEVQDIIEAHL